MAKTDDNNTEKEFNKLLEKYKQCKNKLDKIATELFAYEIENRRAMVGKCFSEFSEPIFYRIDYIDENGNYVGTRVEDSEYDDSFTLESDVVLEYGENEEELLPNEITHKEFNDILRDRLERFVFTNIKGDPDYDFGIEGEDFDFDDED